MPLLSPPPAVWVGCVYARYIDGAPANSQADVVDGTVSTPTGDWVAWQPIGPEGEPVPGYAKCSSVVSNQECTPCLSHGIQALQSDKQTVLDAINELQSPTGKKLGIQHIKPATVTIVLAS